LRIFIPDPFSRVGHWSVKPVLSIRPLAESRFVVYITATTYQAGPRPWMNGIPRNASKSMAGPLPPSAHAARRVGCCPRRVRAHRVLLWLMGVAAAGRSTHDSCCDLRCCGRQDEEEKSAVGGAASVVRRGRLAERLQTAC
jgi:hypothetical protein